MPLQPSKPHAGLLQAGLQNAQQAGAHLDQHGLNGIPEDATSSSQMPADAISGQPSGQAAQV